MKINSHNVILFPIILLYSFAAYTQNNTIDSLQRVLQTQKEDTNKVNTLNTLGKEMWKNNGDYKNAFMYEKEALSLSEKTNFKKGKATALQLMGIINASEANYFEAQKYLVAALKVSEELGDKFMVSKINVSIGQNYLVQEKFSEAIKHSYSSLKADEESGNKKGIVEETINIGFSYYSQGNDSEALKSYTKALKLYGEIGDKEGVAQSNLLMAAIYFNKGAYSEALQKDSIAWKIYKEIGDNQGTPNALSYMGSIYEKQGQIALDEKNQKLAISKFLNARQIYLECVELYKKDRIKSEISLAYLNLGNINIKLNRLPEARDYLEKSLQINSQVNYKEGLKENYQSLLTLDSAQGNYDQAFRDYKLYILYRDSLVNEENKKTIVQSKMQYEFDKKEAIAKAIQDKKDTEAKRIKNQQYFVIAALGVVVLAILIISLIQFRNNKQKQKANLLLQDEKEKVESTLSELRSTQSQLIQSEKMASLGELTAGIAHEIQNPLNFVNNFSEVNKEMIDELQTELKSGNTEEAIAISNDIKDNSEKINHHGKRADAIVKGMLQHSRASSNKKEPTNINALADEYLRLAYHGLRAKDKSFNATMKTDFDNSIGNINIIPQDIGRVILNLITNAFYVVDEKRNNSLTDTIQLFL